jgi:cytochrome bd-type quinol oxidase subunit 2
MMDLQLLMGSVLWVIREQWNIKIASRTWEHPVTMFLAIAIAHVGSVLAKKGEKEDSQRYKQALLCFFVSFALVILGIYRIKGSLP